MPIYEYICDDCKRPFEKLVMNSKEIVACPTCGSGKHTLQFSVVSAHVKGGDGASAKPMGGSCCSPGGCGCQ